jgi:hypothetical protein
MKNSKIEKIKALNLTEGEVITLEKADERKELEAIMYMVSDIQKDTCVGNSGDSGCGINVCVTNSCSCDGAKCTDCYDCFLDVICDCKGPVGYIDCHPYK